VQCINLGLVDPIEASQWLEHFPTPFDAANWRAVGFQPAEAAHWLAAGVRDPFDAQKLQAAENSIQLSSESMREPHPDDES
ncbi:MAG: hypothetical protein KDD44_09305, partial [Bdellovibrionales bacterium]|nr:hypothetical protein [Bdellovibrionales bacterium]